jgi:two-component system, NarL family, invasion response regulator UvrY
MIAKRKKILLVEDHPIVLSGCGELFAENTNFTLLASSTIEQARTAVNAHGPRLAIVDVNLPDGSGLGFTRELVSKKIEVVIFSTSDEPALALRAIDIGAKSFVRKSDEPKCLLLAVEAVARGDTWFPDDLIQRVACLRVVTDKEHWNFSERERSILKLLMEGWRTSEIADKLELPPRMIHAQFAMLRRKLSARTVPQMIAIVARSTISI